MCVNSITFALHCEIVNNVNIFKINNSVANSAYCVRNIPFGILFLITKCPGYHIEEAEMGDACGTHGEHTYRILVGIPAGKR
jgi:hypothetical protein